MGIEKVFSRRTETGEVFEKYVLRDEKTGGYVSVLNLGCILQEIVVPDKNGELRDVAIGYDTVEEYAASHSFFGAILGRYANRIGGARFAIDGVTYNVTPNERGNTLHGGASGFHNKLFTATVEGDELVLTYTSPDGDEGFPGNLTLTERVRFSDGRLDIRYSAVTDAPTVVNISNHSFFNLDGQGRGTVLDQLLQLNASRYCPVDAGLIPTGELADVKGTGFDFTEAKPIGRDIHSQEPMIAAVKGYDVCFSVDGYDGSLRRVATACSQSSGIRMDAYTTLPAFQLYTGMLLGMIPIFTDGKAGSRYEKYGGFCIETQNYPNAMNTPSFKNPVVLRPGEIMESETVYEFSVLD